MKRKCTDRWIHHFKDCKIQVFFSILFVKDISQTLTILWEKELIEACRADICSLSHRMDSLMLNIQLKTLRILLCLKNGQDQVNLLTMLIKKIFFLTLNNKTCLSQNFLLFPNWTISGMCKGFIKLCCERQLLSNTISLSIGESISYLKIFKDVKEELHILALFYVIWRVGLLCLIWYDLITRIWPQHRSHPSPIRPSKLLTRLAEQWNFPNQRLLKKIVREANRCLMIEIERDACHMIRTFPSSEKYFPSLYLRLYGNYH